MKPILLFFALSCFAFTTPSFAKGHGGGHGGGHSSGGHSHAATHSGFQQNNAKTTKTTGNNRAANRTATKAIITRSTSASVIAANHGRSGSHSITVSGPATAAARGGEGSVNNPSYINYNAYTGYYYTGYYNPAYYGYYNNPYYGNPYFYDPYYSMYSFGFGYMYAPNYYYPASSPNYANSSNEDQLSRQPMDGFVVFYNDTLSGAVTVGSRAISMETTDSGKDYDYRFHEKDPGLQYVTVYNEDDKQLNLVRLKGDTKKLWRVIHTGKLNIYDSRRGFIYKPEDIDLKSLTISYNGEVSSLHSSSVSATKEWLTQYINQAYNLNLDPKKFSWNELLIYVDKLD